VHDTHAFGWNDFHGVCVCVSECVTTRVRR
jgi:hypothetical protein